MPCLNTPLKPTLDSIGLLIEFVSQYYPERVTKNYWTIKALVERQLEIPLCDECHASFLGSVQRNFVNRLVNREHDSVYVFARFSLRRCGHDGAKIRDPYGLNCTHLRHFCALVGIAQNPCFCNQDVLCYWRRLTRAVPLQRPVSATCAKVVVAAFGTPIDDPDDLYCYERVDHDALERYSMYRSLTSDPLDIGPPKTRVEAVRPRSCSLETPILQKRKAVEEEGDHRDLIKGNEHLSAARLWSDVAETDSRGGRHH